MVREHVLNLNLDLYQGHFCGLLGMGQAGKADCADVQAQSDPSG